MVLASYALAGFANFGSIAMQIAGMSELAPDKRPMLAELGMRALLGGLIASLMTAAVAGILLP
jgi:CNT family concentrative nucleoside transporter